MREDEGIGETVRQAGAGAQRIGHRMASGGVHRAEAETTIEAAKLLCYKTLWLRDQGLPHTAEAAMCKWWPPKVAFDTLHQCLLTFGHMGYSKDLPTQQRLRDVLGFHIGDGTRQIQKMVIARERVGRVALPHG